MATLDYSMNRGRQVVAIKYASLISLLAGGLLVMYYVAYAPSSSEEEFVETTDIRVHHPFNLPYRQQVLPPEELMHQDWIEPMKEILRTRHAEEKLVPLVACNNAYYGSLLNWMAGMQRSTNISVLGVLVLAFDQELHAKLQERDLSSVYVKMDSLFRYPDDHPVTNQIQMMRWTTARIVNNLGYDVLLTDIDALFVRDPTPLFEEFATSQIIAQQGKHPKELYEAWNATLCTGMALFRTSPVTENYWEITSFAKMYAEDDQVKLNWGLDKLPLVWRPLDNCIPNTWNCTIQGKVPGPDGLEVTFISQELACRDCSELLENLDKTYFWHQKVNTKDGKDKERIAREAKMWFLRDDWEEVGSKSELTGKEWMEEITID